MLPARLDPATERPLEYLAGRTGRTKTYRVRELVRMDWKLVRMDWTNWRPATWLPRARKGTASKRTGAASRSRTDPWLSTWETSR